MVVAPEVNNPVRWAAVQALRLRVPLMPRYLDRKRVEAAVDLYGILLRGGMTHAEALERISVSYGPQARKRRRWFSR